MSDLVKLAKAIGWQWKETHANNIHSWVTPDSSHIWPCSNKEMIEGYFNPFTSADDCEALIRHLNREDFYFKIRMGPLDDFVQLFRLGLPTDEAISRVKRYGNWKQGVCELTIKVIGENNES